MVEEMSRSEQDPTLQLSAYAFDPTHEHLVSTIVIALVACFRSESDPAQALAEYSTSSAAAVVSISGTSGMDKDENKTTSLWSAPASQPLLLVDCLACLQGSPHAVSDAALPRRSHPQVISIVLLLLQLVSNRSLTRLWSECVQGLPRWRRADAAGAQDLVPRGRGDPGVGHRFPRRRGRLAHVWAHPALQVQRRRPLPRHAGCVPCIAHSIN